MTIFGFEPLQDAMFVGMKGKDISEAQDDLLAHLSGEIGDPNDILKMVADEMGTDIDRQVASVAISLLKEGGKPVAILRHRLAEKIYGQGSMF
jgi:hypothetical protein